MKFPAADNISVSSAPNRGNGSNDESLGDDADGAGSGSSGLGVPSQILLRDPSADEYEIETKVSFAPSADFQRAGLIVREDSENSVTLVRGFCAPCVGDGIYFDNNVAGAGFDTASGAVPADTDVVYLRIRHEDGTYTGSYSLDGTNWTELASRDRFLTDPRMGPESGRSVADPVPTAHFDYFDERAI